MKITTRIKYLAALALFASTEETRFYLNGINVRPVPEGGIVMAATDGHTLAAIYDAEGTTDGEHIIKLEEGDLFKTTLSGLFGIEKEFDPEEGASFESIADDDGPVMLDGGIATVFDSTGKDVRFIVGAPPVEGGTFPDYARVFFVKKFGGKQDFMAANPDYLAKFTKAACILTGRCRAHIKVYFAESEKSDKGNWDSAMLVGLDVENFMGAIMPIMVHTSKFPGPEIPHWIFSRESKDGAA